MIPTDDIRMASDRIADRYDRHAALEQEVGRRLFDRIAFQRDEPEAIVDLGCGTGAGAAALKKAFRKSQVAALDLSAGMLARTAKRSRLTRPIRPIQANAMALPFRRHSVDLVVSNLAVPWFSDPSRFLGQVLRVLRPGGMLLFSTYGPESLEQLHQAITAAGMDCAVPGFTDILEIGDALTAAGFREPVMDVDRITLDYPSLSALAEELDATGTSLLIEGWPRCRKQLESLERHWPAKDAGGRVPLSFEILYGAAFGPPEGQPMRTDRGEIATFSVDSLLKSRTMG
ncbi:MAG: methyltransferase domain-containing protein [Gammaproteobacteria bacterium]|nr:methyltransferase domain-containing protein [Gammaproteobacteria bacterium]